MIPSSLFSQFLYCECCWVTIGSNFLVLSAIHCSVSNCPLHSYSLITTRVILCSCAKSCVAMCATLLLIPLVAVSGSAVIGSFCNALNIAMLEDSVVGYSEMSYFMTEVLRKMSLSIQLHSFYSHRGKPSPTPPTRFINNFTNILRIYRSVLTAQIPLAPPPFWIQVTNTVWEQLNLDSRFVVAQLTRFWWYL